MIVPNFRPIMGMGAVPSVVAYRTSHLHGISAATQVQLLRLGVTDVVDLRTAAESQAKPNTLPANISLRLADVLADNPPSGATKINGIAGSRLAESSEITFSTTQVDEIMHVLGNGRGKEIMLSTYADFVSLPSSHAAYKTLLNVVRDPNRVCVLNCTAGKDRTGWGAALLQGLAGCAYSTIERDFLDSNAQWSNSFTPILEAFAAAGGQAEALGSIMWVDADYLAHSYETLVENFGSLEQYAVEGVGLTPAELTGLQQRLNGIIAG